jgi:hypothetical protein
MLFTIDSAKEFLLAKVRDQAARDGVTFDDIEQRMFLFSETSGPPDMEAEERFDGSYDANAYEAKVTKLLRKAYAHDKRNADRKKEWKDALKALSPEDFYGLVMVDQANIPRVDVGWQAFVLEMLPLAITELAVIGLCWFVVFRPSGIMGALPDWAHIVALLLFFLLFWYVGNVFGRVGPSPQARRPARNSDKNS